ncbi:E3 ubiquitin-protein ligase rnf14 [Plakobranchus ocellatus]|uniref:E3 ubiquitin-protein ligase rnf14 n=1 Tax=Plakobranchus ocellatus TaxID=259542 RepID=A0AAV3XUZ6_9GAST|nr:E3 ubiquitin-protein ligase rnf14 [Plakobranchus ocellatus]
MRCVKCGQNFCYLCKGPVSRRDPYSHYSMPGQMCFSKLFYGVPDLDYLFPEDDLVLLLEEEEGMFDDAED